MQSSVKKLKAIVNIVQKMCLVIAVVLLLVFLNDSAYAKEPVVIVIDPGHGGENLGAEYEEYTEKFINMTVAQAMKEELEKYEDVIVYLTHESPEDDMTLEERALFAKEKKADFLFCLHFNMSVHHNLFGAETWISAFGGDYAKGYAYSEILMEQFTDLGLYSRGIKTKLNLSGENYYGILRHCTNEGIPAVLIEHCHLDQINDQPFYQMGEEQLKEFGRMDADAAARYFQLSSPELGNDYSSYAVPEVAMPSGAVTPDMTEPEICELELLEVNEETGEITLKLHAQDTDSYILYYNYSLNGGNTYSDLERWNKEEDSMIFTIKAPANTELEIRANAYNGFDVWVESNIIEVPALSYHLTEQEQEIVFSKEETYEEIVIPDLKQEAEEQDAAISSYSLWIGIIVSLIILCLLILSSRFILLSRSSKRVKEDN